MVIPQQWKSLNLSQLLELKYLNPSDFESGTDFYIQKISIATGINEDELSDLTHNELIKSMAMISFTNVDPVNAPKRVGIYDLKDFKDLTLGEFIDIENYIRKGLEVGTIDILITLYRRFTLDEWGQRIYEPLTAVNFEKRRKEFENFTAEIYGVIPEYLKFRNDFINKRKPLFGIEDDDEESDDDELNEDEKDVNEELLKKYSWHLLLYNLAKGDITKIDEITDLNLFFVYGMVAMKFELKID